MLSVSKGYDTAYLTDEVGSGREGYYTDASAAGEPPGVVRPRRGAARADRRGGRRDDAGGL